MAEVILRHRLAARGEQLGNASAAFDPAAPTEVVVSSAGLLTEGSPAAEPAVDVMADIGLDLRGHQSRLVSADLIERSDLVVGLAREHVREVVLSVPTSFGRTFTLKELVRRATDRGGRRPDEAFGDWLARLHEGRTQMMHLGSSPDDDVDDPIGRRPAVYERVGDELEDLIDRLVDLGWPVPDRPAPPDETELAST
jgi:protein-tyrosine phosphatase